jgi:hypothetical protein
MEIKQCIKLKTDDAKYILDKSLGSKRGLFKDAVRKIAMMYKQAADKQAYPYTYLIAIKVDINKTIDHLKKSIHKTEKVIKRQSNFSSKAVFPTKYKVQLSFSNPIIFGLIEMLQYFDRFICLISYAKNLNAFNHQNSYYNFKNKHKRKIFRLLSQIVRTPLRNLPPVTIENYLNDHPSYLNAISQFGEIKPQALYNALCSSVTPPLSAKELNRIEARLRERVKNTVS